MKTINLLIIVLLFFSASVIIYTQSITISGHNNLPNPDTIMAIKNLGPCTDDSDRTIRLNSSKPVTILVHGCHGSAGRFKNLSDVLAFQGQQSICFSYNDRENLMQSSRKLVKSIEELQKYTDQITVIGHSMGGLIAHKAFISNSDENTNLTSDIKLVTVSAPLSGIQASRFCAKPLIRVATFGIHDFVCWIISGDKWLQITPGSDFIKTNGKFDSAVKNIY
jgi:triacylglycerol esterase/lipase EstA (alpha/beta hydrolase family)